MSFIFDAHAALAQIQAQSEPAATAATVATADVPKCHEVAEVAAVAAAPMLKAGAPDLDRFEETAAILEYDQCLTRAEAEQAAAEEQGYATPAAMFFV